MAPSLILPPEKILAAAATALVERTTDINEQALLNKAIYFLGRGAEIVPTAGGFLIPSSDKRTVYRISHLGICSCKGGATHGRCYHAKMLTIIEEAQIHNTMPALPARPLGERLAAARKATAALNELFA
jgi:hypothetical protein